MNLDQFDIKRLTLKEGDVLLVRAPRRNMPIHAWENYANNIKSALQVYFLTTKIIIIDDEIDITVIEKEKIK